MTTPASLITRTSAEALSSSDNANVWYPSSTVAVSQIGDSADQPDAAAPSARSFVPFTPVVATGETNALPFIKCRLRFSTENAGDSAAHRDAPAANKRENNAEKIREESLFMVVNIWVVSMRNYGSKTTRKPLA